MAFASLYALSSSKDAWVLDLWGVIDTPPRWGTGICVFVDTFYDWKLGIVEFLLSILQDKSMNREDIDIMIWKESKNEVFSIKFL